MGAGRRRIWWMYASTAYSDNKKQATEKEPEQEEEEDTDGRFESERGEGRILSS